MTKPLLLVLPQLDAEARSTIESTADGRFEVNYLCDAASADRARLLSEASAVLSRQIGVELEQGEAGLLGQAKLLQCITAGVDHIPLGTLPAQLPVASNAGGYAEPMAEHALAMTLAALKRLFVEHAKINDGNFDQFRSNRMLAGATCGILGLGGIGVACAQLMRTLGARVHGINRSGASADSVDWIGTRDNLPELLADSDILLLCLPLTHATTSLLGAAQLACMKNDAILVNLARGEIIHESALYNHLLAHPNFTACIDAWWIEPVRHGEFRQDHPFTSLPNVIASPHNSASAQGWRHVALQRAVHNTLRILDDLPPLHLVASADRMQ